MLSLSTPIDYNLFNNLEVLALTLKYITKLRRLEILEKELRI